MEFPKSIGLLLLGILKRLYYLIPSLFSDPFDITERWLKVTFEPPQWLFWLLLSIGLAIAVILAYHEIRMQKVLLEKQLDDRTKKKEIRETLGSFLEECIELQSKSANDKEPPEKETEDIIGRLQSFLHDKLGDAYIARLNSSAGITGFMVDTVKHPNYWQQFYRWSFRLNEFITELKD